MRAAYQILRSQNLQSLEFYLLEYKLNLSQNWGQFNEFVSKYQQYLGINIQ